MSTNNFFRDDLTAIHNIIQSSMIVYPKEIIIATLKDFFSRGSLYHYAKDVWGFAAVTDHTDLPLGSDIPSVQNQPGLSTRVYIGENYKSDALFFPCVLVKSGGSRYVPISINREKGSIQYEQVVFEDGYGNQSIVARPKSFVTAGVWEGSIIIDIKSRSLRARDDLLELIGMCFAEITVDSLYDIGLIVKPPVISAPSEGDDRNDKLYQQSITLDIRTEYRREIPIKNVIDAILFSVEFGDILNPNAPIAQNLTIKTELDLIDAVLG